MNKITPDGPVGYEPKAERPPAGQWTMIRSFTPVIAPLLDNRWLARVLIAAAVTQLLLIAGGRPGWQCPIHSAVGIPCPGCGMTTALILLFRGDWPAAMQAHAFAPLMAPVFVLIALAAILPSPYQRRLSWAVANVERRTGITTFVLIGMVAYWLLRLFGNDIL